MTRDKNAGNPLTMLYVGGDKEVSETTLGIWARGYFTTKGVSNAYGYILNEEALEEIGRSTEVYVRKPVVFFEDKGEEDFDIQASLSKISVLTAKKGLPQDDLAMNGLMEPSYDAPAIVQDQRDEPGSDLPASAFSTASILTVILGAAAIVLVLKFMKKNQKSK